MPHILFPLIANIVQADPTLNAARIAPSFKTSCCNSVDPQWSQYLFLYYTRDKSEFWHRNTMKYYLRFDVSGGENVVGIGLICRLYRPAFQNWGIAHTAAFSHYFHGIEIPNFITINFTPNEIAIDKTWPWTPRPSSAQLANDLITLINKTKAAIDTKLP